MAETIGVKIGTKTIEQPLTELWEFDSSGRMIYHGQAAPGSSAGDSVWRICKYSYTGTNFNADDKKWANGSANFDKEWDERAGTGYTYS